MTGNWMIGGQMRVNRILPDEEVMSINSAAGTADLPRLRQLASSPQPGMTRAAVSELERYLQEIGR